MSGRNPIHRIGSAPARDYTKVSNGLIRHGAAQLGPDAFTVMLLLRGTPVENAADRRRNRQA